ncbi:MAG: hypothetical protein QM487_01235 [Candidatus Marithrix sp.]
MSNSIIVIFPYRYQDTWVFDDEQVGLIKEPFVEGMPTIIDVFVKDISNANQGFRLLFSNNKFPNYQAELIWVKKEFEGNWYYWQQHELTGWLCPALYKYFSIAPKYIYCKAESLY